LSCDTESPDNYHYYFNIKHIINFVCRYSSESQDDIYFQYYYIFAEDGTFHIFLRLLYNGFILFFTSKSLFLKKEVKCLS